MKQTDAPDKFPIPWANDAGVLYVRNIPVNSQIGTVDGAASLEDGWPPLNFADRELGGIPPSGLDDNGIKRQITANLRWCAAGMVPKYDVTFSALIGGYPKGAVLQRLDEIGYWRSTVDDNTTDPDSGGAGWSPMTVTSTNDPTYNNDSHVPASTSWIRRAMSAIFISLGYAASFATNGYIKLPSCLGSFVIQWGEISLNTNVLTSVNLPIPFSGVFLKMVASMGNGISGSAGRLSIGAQPDGLSRFKIIVTSPSTGTIGSYWIAVGR